MGQRMQFRPSLDRYAALVEESPTQGTRQAESTVVRRAAANADQAALGAFGVRGRNHRSQTERVQFKRMMPARRQPRQAVHAGGLDDRRARLWFPPPLGGAGLVCGVHRGYRVGFGVETGSHQFAKAISAVADGKQRQMVGGTRLPPSARHGVGGGTSGQRAFEFIGSDQNVHACRGLCARRTPPCNPLFRNRNRQKAVAAVYDHRLIINTALTERRYSAISNR